MRKFLCAIIALFLLLAGCKKPITPQSEAEIADEPLAITERKCAADEVLQAQLAADPSLRERMAQIEAFTKKAIQSGVVTRLVDGYIEIPVVVHVLWNTAVQNIDDNQVASQIAVLNQDFQNKNIDKSLIPQRFQSVASAGMKIKFVLATGLPQNPIHKYTKVKQWSTNDAMKFSKRGGSDAVDPTNNLNIWVCNLGGGVLGYAQFPGGNPKTDGIVVLFSAFGSKRIYETGTYIAKYDLGRTATHEVGHWMNLRHIWGDDNGACFGSDDVNDTPNQGGPNYGCPGGIKVSCNNESLGGDMHMNYMDYTDDACMYMYSTGQAERALAVFASGGPRAVMGSRIIK